MSRGRMSRQCLGRLSGYTVDVETVFLPRRTGESVASQELFFLIDCILTSHVYGGKVYPTYCKCYVFKARITVSVRFYGCDT